MFRLAMKWGRVARSPFSDGGVEFLQEQGRERILSFEEERRYLRAANSTLRDVGGLMTETGMRPDEVFTIRQENVHLHERFIHVPTGKTKNAKRDVFLTDASYQVVKCRLTAAKGPYLFPRRLGHRSYDWNRAMTQIWNTHHEALAKRGITPPFKLYGLRHTYGTRAAESGVDPLTLMPLMGHANLQTTNRSVHLSKRHLAEAQKKLEAYRIERMLAEAGQEPRRPM